MHDFLPSPLSTCSHRHPLPACLPVIHAARLQSKMRRLNLPLLFLLIVVIISASTISYQSLNQTDASEKHLRTLNKEKIAELQELKRLLRGIASDDNVIIVTMLDRASVPFLDLFLESFQVGEGTKNLLSFILISAMDQMAFDRCRAVHTHCYFLGYNYNLVNKDKNFRGGDDIITQRMMMMKAQLELLQRILDVGYSLIYTDVDVMWFRNPLTYFDPLHLLILSTDVSDGSPSPNGGFIYARSCSQIVDFFRHWRVLWRLHTDLDRQAILSLAVRPIQGRRPPFGLPIHFLDTAYFGGFCEHGQDWGKIRTMQANCCSSAEEKLHGLTALVQDWKNYTALSISNWNVAKYRCRNV